MKLSLLTYNLGREFALEKLIEVAEKCGYDGIEFRAGVGPHGVELTATQEQRAAIKARMASSRVAIAGIGTSCRFESLDAAERLKQVSEAKAYIDLARDIGAPRIRVFGNSFPAGADRNTVVRNVGDCLREIGEYAAACGVDCNLELHGDFWRWEYTLGAIQAANHPRIGAVYNCDMREIQCGAIGHFLDPIRPHLRHIHMHELENGYPYQLLFRYLKNMGYSGFLSVESDTPSPDAERILRIYALLYRAWVSAA